MDKTVHKSTVLAPGALHILFPNLLDRGAAEVSTTAKLRGDLP